MANINSTLDEKCPSEAVGLAAKPFLGGYRNKNLLVEYHHACTQADRHASSQLAHPTRSHRDTQTRRTRQLSVQTASEACTQMDKTGLYIDRCRDKIVSYSGRYISSEEIEEREMRAARVIQRFCRRWLRRRRLNLLKQHYQRIRQWKQQDRLRKQQAKQQREKELILNQQHPHNELGFSSAMHALEQWRVQTTTRSKQSPGKLGMKSEDIVGQQATAIRNMDYCRSVLYRQQDKRHTERLMSKCQSALLWPLSSGQLIHIETQQTAWARQLWRLYNSLDSSSHLDERVSALCCVCNMICQCPRTPLSDSLYTLCTRQIDMLCRGAAVGKLDSLHSRIIETFGKVLRECVNVNPAVERYQALTSDAQRDVGELRQCASCGHVRSVSEFPVSTDTSTTSSSRCRACMRLQNRATSRRDQDVFWRMLDELRRDEQRRSPSSLACFVVQPDDLMHLVMRVWHGRSVLSGTRALHELCLCRWQVQCDWSPCNCVLMDRTEAEAHYRLDQPVSGVYGAKLCRTVHARHVAAGKHFHALPAAMKRVARAVHQLGIDEHAQHDVSDCWQPQPPQNTIDTLFAD